MPQANKVAILSHVEPGYNAAWITASNEVTRRYDAISTTPRREVVRYYALDILTLSYVDGRVVLVSINTGTASTTSTRRHVNAALQRHGIKARVYISPAALRRHDAVRGHMLVTPRQGDAAFTTVVERYVDAAGFLVSHDASHDTLSDAVWPAECAANLRPQGGRLPAAE